jgi:hypothetical protein
VLAKPGDLVSAGTPLLRLHAEEAERMDAAVRLLADPEPAVIVSAPGAAYSRLPLVLDILD